MTIKNIEIVNKTDKILSYRILGQPTIHKISWKDVRKIIYTDGLARIILRDL